MSTRKLSLPFLSWGEQLCRYARFVKFSHTIFAFPFALTMAVIVAQTHPVTAEQLLWISLCLIAARTSAMSFNRIVDHKMDAANPRTMSRELPSGKVSGREAWSILILSSVAFVIFSGQLGSSCLYLSVPVLLILHFYSVTKRFTRWSHVVLGVCLALAPGGVWFALTLEWSWLPVPLMLAVLFWVAGFDILYSCQDVEFDSQSRYFSVPARLGLDKAFMLAKAFHLFAVLFLAVSGVVFHLGAIYFLGVVVFGLFMVSQYRLITPSNLDRIDLAFFSRNAMASVVFFLFVVADSLSLIWLFWSGQ